MRQLLFREKRSHPPAIGATGDAVRDVSAKTDSETTPGNRSPRRRGHIRIGDDDFDSFNEALHTALWVVVWHFGRRLDSPDPRLLLIDIIWYKLRKTRLQKTVLKLAERGAMAPAQAVTR